MKLHLGCGNKYLLGYTHVDFSFYPHVDYIGHVGYLPWCESRSVEIIYASHVFEYFHPTKEAPAVLHEWKRVLTPGGILRLAVPDFRALAEVYLSSNDLKLVRGPLYGHWESSTRHLQHATVYDYATLEACLLEAGFMDVQLWDWRQIFVEELAGFDDYSQAYIPHMNKEAGKLISLNMQAQAPCV